MRPLILLLAVLSLAAMADTLEFDGRTLHYNLSPTTYLPSQAFTLWDKAQHALAFAALGALGALAYPRRLGLLAANLLLFGGAIELAQAATGWRSGDWADWLADAIGLVAGLPLASLSRRVLARSLAGRSAS